MPNCPKCEKDISDTHEPADPSVGIMTGGWYCSDCDEPIADYEYEPDYEEDYI